MYFCHKERWIRFYIDKFIWREIYEWNRSIVLTSRQLASLKSAGNPLPDYVLRLTPLNNKITIEVERDIVGRITIDRFKKVMDVRPIYKDILLHQVMCKSGFKYILIKSAESGCFLEIDFDFYQLEKRIELEASSGRYKYEFFYFYARINNDDGAVVDTQTGYTYYLDPWADELIP